MTSQDQVLAELPDGASVAVITMLGSLCPVTLGHVECFVEARNMILGKPEANKKRPARLEHFDECLGLAWLNLDSLVNSKIRQKGQEPLCLQDRSRLLEVATAEYPWLCYDDGDGLQSLCHRWPRLSFVRFDMNGADDAAKQGKWDQLQRGYRKIIMGRPGYTQEVLFAMRRRKIDPDDGHCFLGPTLPDISSTAAREASARGDREALLSVLHPAVADWMLRRDGHDGLITTPTQANARGEVAGSQC